MPGFDNTNSRSAPATPRIDDEGGLRPPAEYGFWRKVWWWFDFLILVKLARLRFIAILVAIGAVVTQWDTLVAYYEKWTRPTAEAAVSSDIEYFCPMHPSVVRSNNKEKCPVCFMPLSKRKKGSETIEPLPAGIVNRVQLSPYRVVLAGVQTFPVEYQRLTKEIKAIGFVEFNERGQRTVPARVKGRIDELFVNETGQMVNANDVLASVYSPDLYVAVQELLTVSKGSSPSLIAVSRSRLQLLGIGDDQIDEIVKAGKANTHLQIRSPISGHVIKKYVVEGQYIDEGRPLYDVADLSTVWIQAQIYEDDLALLPLTHAPQQGTAINDLPAVIATTRAIPDQEFHGQLTFIYPHVDQTSRTVTVRFEVDNPDHRLRPGNTATVRLSIDPRRIRSLAALTTPDQQARLAQGEVLAVPENSIIDTGRQTIVYRESRPGVYEGVAVKLGPRMSGANELDFFPVLAGLQPGEKVVTSGSFLVDAETRLNPAAGSIYFGGSGGSKSTTASTVRATTPEDPDAKISAALAQLPPEEQRLAESQRFCAVLANNRLGSMGPPIKLTLEGESVFICCEGCRETAAKNAKETVAKLRKRTSRGEPGPQP